MKEKRERKRMRRWKERELRKQKRNRMKEQGMKSRKGQETSIKNHRRQAEEKKIKMKEK